MKQCTQSYSANSNYNSINYANSPNNFHNTLNNYLSPQKAVFPTLEKPKVALFPSYQKSEKAVFPMTEMGYDVNTKKSIVARDIADIAQDVRYGNAQSLNSAKEKVASSGISNNLKESLYKNLDTSQKIGKLYLDFLNSDKGNILLGYLAKKGGHSEGIDKLIVSNDDKSQVIAATAPKQKPGFILYNEKAAESYKRFLKHVTKGIDDKLMDEDFLAHEIAHSYLHDQNSDKLQAEIEVEKVLAYVNSAKARNTNNSSMKNQYNALASDHIRRYMLHKEEEATLNGEKFNSEKEMENLYKEYAAEFAQGQDSEAMHMKAEEKELGNLETIVAESE